VRKGKYVRRMTYPESRSVNLIRMSEESGDIVVHSWQDLSLHAFSLNGFCLASIPHLGEKLHAMAITPNGQMLLTGGSRATMMVYLVHSLAPIHDLYIGK